MSQKYAEHETDIITRERKVHGSVAENGWLKNDRITVAFIAAGYKMANGPQPKITYLDHTTKSHCVVKKRWEV